MAAREPAQRPILVFPRALLPQAEFLPAWDVPGLLEEIAAHAQWMNREDAEQSRTWVQPIPCAMVNRGGLYLALRRTQRTRADLSSRITLLTGGHIDFHEDSAPAMTLFADTLLRELSEELSIEHVSRLTPVGVVTDLSSGNASRHVAFVYEAKISGEIKTLADEEFVLNSSFSGMFVPWGRLANFEGRLDPWSRILCNTHISRRIFESLQLPTDHRQLAFRLTR
jgi:predicted NUDIX family phosphoesterase